MGKIKINKKIMFFNLYNLKAHKKIKKAKLNGFISLKKHINETNPLRKLAGKMKNEFKWKNERLATSNYLNDNFQSLNLRRLQLRTRVLMV